jgi:hypothetical protein
LEIDIEKGEIYLKKELLLNNRYVRLLIMSLVIILALSFVNDFAEFLDKNSDKYIKLGTNLQCNPLKSICSASIINDGEFQRISFSVNDWKTRSDEALNEFSMAITATGFDFDGIESISVSFDRPDESIEGAVILFQPDKSSDQVVPENWHAKAELAMASNGKTGWLAVVRLKSSKNGYRAEFPLSGKN